MTTTKLSLVPLQSRKYPDVFEKGGFLPDEALMFGVCKDGLPMLLNTMDSVPGSVLVVGENKTEVTGLLQSVTGFIEAAKAADNYHYIVISNDAEKWSDFGASDLCVNVADFRDYDRIEILLTKTISFMTQNRQKTRALIIIFDGLEDINVLSGECQQKLAYIFFRGPNSRIQPIVSLSLGGVGSSWMPWLATFRTRMFGKITDTNNIKRLNAPAQVSELEPNQFLISEDDGVVVFSY